MHVGDVTAMYLKLQFLCRIIHNLEPVKKKFALSSELNEVEMNLV